MNATEIGELIFRIFGAGLGAAAVICIVIFAAQFIVDSMRLRRAKKRTKTNKNE